MAFGMTSGMGLALKTPMIESAVAGWTWDSEPIVDTDANFVYTNSEVSGATMTDSATHYNATSQGVENTDYDQTPASTIFSNGWEMKTNSGYATFTPDDAFGTTGSIQMWVKNSLWNNGTTNCFLHLYLVDGTDSVYIGPTAGNELVGYVYMGGTLDKAFGEVDCSGFNSANWNYLLITYDTVADELKGYRAEEGDGSPTLINTATTLGTPTANNLTNGIIGAKTGGTARYGIGTYSGVAWWPSVKYP